MQETNYPGDIFRTSLSADELAAVLDLYPPAPNPAVTSISGRVTRAGQPVFGAYIVAFQGGTPVVGGIADPNGNYSIRRLPDGTYTVRVLTIRAPVSAFYGAIDNDFLSEVYLDSATDPATSVMTDPNTDVPMIDIDVAAADTEPPRVFRRLEYMSSAVIVVVS